jgi:hypothetical protein
LPDFLHGEPRAGRRSQLYIGHDTDFARPKLGLRAARLERTGHKPKFFLLLKAWMLERGRLNKQKTDQLASAESVDNLYLLRPLLNCFFADAPGLLNFVS